ncbi:MAG: LysE family translocator [Spirochaetes bacterium]|nr:LysE family translocator [Spirochaetota bacterium]
MIAQPSFIEFAFITLTVSLSGVMAPGPMSAVTINHGTRSKYAGLLVSTGHAIIELPVIIALFAGIQVIMQFANITSYITLSGGIVLVILATLTAQSVKANTTITTYTPLLDGIILSAFNPYFYVWWLTIGLSLIQKGIIFGSIGLAAFSFLHIVCDYIWLLILSMLSFAGASFLGAKFTKTVGFITVIMLYAFGLYFIYDAIKQIV